MNKISMFGYEQSQTMYIALIVGVILDVARMVEEDENIMAMSPHFITILIKK